MHRDHILDKSEILNEINRRMELHPGDIPWGCLDCHHGKSCVQKEILKLALKQLKFEGESL